MMPEFYNTFTQSTQELYAAYSDTLRVLSPTRTMWMPG